MMFFVLVFRSPSPAQDKVNRSGSTSPNLQIDEPGSPSLSSIDKRKRDSSEEKTVKKKSRIIDSDSEEDPFEKDKKDDQGKNKTIVEIC